MPSEHLDKVWYIGELFTPGNIFIVEANQYAVVDLMESMPYFSLFNPGSCNKYGINIHKHDLHMLVISHNKSMLKVLIGYVESPCFRMSSGVVIYIDIFYLVSRISKGYVELLEGIKVVPYENV